MVRCIIYEQTKQHLTKTNSLTVFCGFGNSRISDDNNFEASCEDFCVTNEGVFPPVSTNFYHLNNETNFHYNYSSHSFNITSSNLPIENIAVYNNNGKLLKNYNINNSSSLEIDVSYFLRDKK